MVFFSGGQQEAFDIVKNHYETFVTEPLRLLISGTAGTGNSFLIHELKRLLGECLKVSAPTGVAAYNVKGVTNRSLFRLPVNREFKPLKGEI